MTKKYISLDDVMTIIARKHLFKDKTDFDKCVHAIAEQIKALDTIEAEPQEWISVKDRLPETIGKEVLISGRRGGNGEPFIRVAKFGYDDYYDEPKFEGDEGENYFCDAWRELPSPYKGE